MSSGPGPSVPYCQSLHARKYRGPGEDFRGFGNRVASHLKDSDRHYFEFRDPLLDMRFMPGGRIQSACGSPRLVTAYNCYSRGTEVLTDRGFVRFGDVIGETLNVLSPVTGGFEPAEFKSYGMQRLTRITVSNSSRNDNRSETFIVRATANHRWILQNGAETTALVPGMILKAGDCDPELEGYERAWVHGFIFGDGSRQHRDGRYQIRLCGRKACHLERILEAFPDAVVTYPQSLEGDPFVRLDSDVDLKGLPDDASHSSYIGAFIAGLLAADGSFTALPYQVHGSENTVRWVRDRLVLAGYAPCGRVRPSGSMETNYGARFEQLFVQVFRTCSDHKGFRVVAIELETEDEEVFCCEEPIGRQVVLRNGLRSGQCFVSGAIHDSFVHGGEEGPCSSIMGRATEAATTMRMGGGIGYDFCVDPGSMILMADLTWKRAEDVRAGERIIGFDEDMPLNRARLQESIVESNEELTQPKMRIITDRGETIVSATHMFRARRADFNPRKLGDGYSWITAEDLQPGDQIAYCIAPWSQDDMSPWDAGWLAGILDGEGCVSIQECPSGATKGFLSVAQNPGPVLDRILELLEKYGFEYSVNGRPKDQCRQVRLSGKWQALRALSLSGSIRLLSKARKLWDGCRISTKSNPPARVSEVSRIDDGRVMALRTSTRTFIGDGFFSHNSTLRPHGGLIEGLQSRSCGPLGFMPVYSAVGLATSSTDHRRGAQMGVLSVEHPDIEEFIRSKNNDTDLRGFNLSVAVTHRFMEAKAAGRPFELRFGGRTYSTVDPNALWELIMRSTWDYAEPGVLFIDTINDWNNLWYCERISATNPCGEQPLPPYGACLLGSFNLTRYVLRAAGGRYEFDFDRLAADVPAVVRAMDNVVDRTIYPLPRQEQEARSKRRMGIGYTGLANAGEALGLPYGSPGFLAFEARVGETITHACYRTSIELAREKGAFPLFDAERYLRGRFVRTLPDDILWGIERYGIRNSHLTSIAPTGTISLAADNVSSGLEPVFDYEFKRTEQRFDGPREEVIQDYGVRVFGVHGKRCRDVTVAEHVAVLATAQRTTDSACSKTCNVDPEMPWEEFKGAYDRAYELGCKGMTTFNPSGKRNGVLVSMEEGGSCAVDLETGRRSCE